MNVSILLGSVPALLVSSFIPVLLLLVLVVVTAVVGPVERSGVFLAFAHEFCPRGVELRVLVLVLVGV